MNISWLFIPLSVFWIANADIIRRRCRNYQFECDDGGCIRKDNWCSSYRNYYCNDDSDRRDCNNYYPNCGQNQIHCTSNKRCIPLKWACDGYKDCDDNSDEQNCLKEGFGIKNIPGVQKSKESGYIWLSKQRRKNWSWGKNTNRAVVTLSLSDYFNLENLTSQIIVKQTKLQLSQLLLMNDIRKFKLYEMALYVNSLLATCINPRNFQEFDLVEILEERIKDSDSVNPMVALAICNSNGSVSSEQIVELRDLLFKENLPHLIETRAYALMALNCLKNKTSSYQQNFTEEISFNSSNFLDFNEVKRDFAKLQNKDGSFGNIYTTAVLLHALLSTKTTDDFSENYWNVTNAFRYLISQQDKDGSFGGILASYLILPLMNGKTFVDLGKLNCSFIKPGNITVQEEFDNKRVKKYRTNYYIVVGENKDIVFSLSLNVPINSTFYDVMRLAAELDPRFRFKYIDYPGGKYIYSLFGLVNNPESKNYWQLFKTEQNLTSVMHYPDKVIVREEDTYIFWYKVIDI